MTIAKSAADQAAEKVKDEADAARKTGVAASHCAFIALYINQMSIQKIPS
jgi:hypothetical protein